MQSRRHSQAFIRSAGLAVLAIGIVTVMIWLSYRPQFEITDVSIVGSDSSTSVEIKSLVYQQLADTVFGILPASNTFLFSSRNLIDGILREFKSFSDVTVDREGLHALVVKVKERSPKFLWCNDEIVDVGELCYYMDAGGLVFGGVQDSDDSEYLSFYGFFDPELDPVGQVYLGAERFKEVSSFITSLTNIDFPPSSFRRTRDGEYHLTVRGSTELFLKGDGDLGGALLNFGSLLHDEELSDLFEKDTLPFEYIDLRLARKVFYRRR